MKMGHTLYQDATERKAVTHRFRAVGSNRCRQLVCDGGPVRWWVFGSFTVEADASGSSGGASVYLTHSELEVGLCSLLLFFFTICNSEEFTVTFSVAAEKRTAI